MFSGALRRSLTLLLIMLFTASMMLAGSGATATLVATGGVFVNGSAVLRSTAVFGGDNIRTNQGGAVSVALAGSTVVVPSNSSVVYESNAIAVNSGTVIIKTASGLKARTSRYTISPATAGSARFQVAKANGEVTISALRGAVTVSGAGGTSTLAEGKSETLDDASDKDKDQGPPPAAAASGGGVSGRTLAIIAGVGGGAAAAIALLTTGSPSKAVSPSTP